MFTGYGRMRHALFLAIALIASPCAMAGSPVITMTKDHHSGNKAMSVPARDEYSFTLQGEGCKINLEMILMVKGGMGFSPLTEECKNAGEETADAHLEKLFAKVFASGVLQGRNEITITKTSVEPFECKMVRYASASEEWKTLLGKYGNKPILNKDRMPSPQNTELGEFLRKGGLLRNLENILGAHGFRLKQVTVLSFSAAPLEYLWSPELKKCLPAKPIVSIAPDMAELELKFEAIFPGSRSEDGIEGAFPVSQRP